MAVSHWEAILILYQGCNSTWKWPFYKILFIFASTIYPHSQDLLLATRQESICQNNDRMTGKIIALLWTLLLWTTYNTKGIQTKGNAEIRRKPPLRCRWGIFISNLKIQVGTEKQMRGCQGLKVRKGLDYKAAARGSIFGVVEPVCILSVVKAFVKTPWTTIQKEGVLLYVHLKINTHTVNCSVFWKCVRFFLMSHVCNSRPGINWYFFTSLITISKLLSLPPPLFPLSPRICYDFVISLLLGEKKKP